MGMGKGGIGVHGMGKGGIGVHGNGEGWNRGTWVRTY